MSKQHASTYTTIAIIALTLLAGFLRLWRLDSVPPGWRDDELINSLVISQKVLDGDLAVYYADASGHEALYHAFNALMLGLFGPTVAGIRWLSVFLGTLTVPLTFLVGRRLFDDKVGLVAAALLTVSFWSLMYSRTGIRHIALPVFALATFYFFLRGLDFDSSQTSTEQGRSRHAVHKENKWVDFLLAGIFMGLGFYTYFASRGMPLILLAFCIYLLLFARDLLGRHWRGILLTFVAAFLLALPLLVTLRQQPESEARVEELAVPLMAATEGDFGPLGEHILITVNMFHSDGDDEWLYNIPHRPVFGPIGAIFFWSGVLIAFWYALVPITSRINSRVKRNTQYAISAAFLLFWFLAGISPSFISVPPGSLGHTILAQSSVYILTALPVGWIARRSWQWRHLTASRLAALLGILLVSAVAVRDLPDYFQKWPERGMVRFLYRADIADVAGYLNANPALTDFGITGLLAGPWDKIALEIDLNANQVQNVNPRWHNSERALLLIPNVSFGGFPNGETPFADQIEPLPEGESIGGYKLNRVVDVPTVTDSICFQNGLCWVSAAYDNEGGVLELGWSVQRPLQLPAIPLISNPPPPGVYSGPRLYVFAQLQDAHNGFLVGDDGLWIDPTTLQPGDLFVQQHWLAAPDGLEGVTAVFGLYDPKTGERILTVDGEDYIRIQLTTTDE